MQIPKSKKYFKFTDYMMWLSLEFSMENFNFFNFMGLLTEIKYIQKISLCQQLDKY